MGKEKDCSENTVLKEMLPSGATRRAWDLLCCGRNAPESLRSQSGGSSLLPLGGFQLR